MGSLLAFAGAVGVVISVIALVRGRLGWAHLRGRRPAAWTLVGAAALLAVGGALNPPAAKTAADPATTPNPAASSPVAAPATAPATATPPAAVTPSPTTATPSAPAVTRTVAGSVLLPDGRRTPGAVFAGVSAGQVCVSGWSAAHRDVSDSLRRQVFTSYGIPWSRHGGYEVDHLVPLELGGSNSIRNLWPEPETAATAGAASKDRLENQLHALVCAGQLSLPTAQQAIASNWYTAYHRYMTVAAIPGTPAPRTQPAASTPPPTAGGGATALCNDGTLSYVAHHQGACSHHGGVRIFYH